MPSGSATCACRQKREAPTIPDPALTWLDANRMFGLQISAKVGALVSIVFAAICLWFALDGFSSPGDVADAESISGGREFAWFWAFLALVGFAIAWLSWTLGARKDD